jgi:DNA gyrase subunit A
VNLINLAENETITAALAVREFTPNSFCTMCTVKGRMKRVNMTEFEAVRPSGIIAISLEQGDMLGWVHATPGTQDVIIVSAHGRALRFRESKARAMGRTAGGVSAIRLRDGDYVASMDVVVPRGELLVVTEKGYGKRTQLEQYPVKGRNTGGVRTIADRYEETGPIVAARVVMPEDEITLITAGGIALRTAVDNVRAAGRATLGVRVISLDDGDRLASLARLEANPEENARAMAEAATQTGAGVESEDEEEIEDEVADDDVEDTEEATAETVE